MNGKQVDDTELTFFNVIKYVMPQRKSKKHQNLHQNFNKNKDNNMPKTEHAIYHEDEKQYAKLELPILSQKIVREKTQIGHSDERGKASNKKITNFAKNQQHQIEGRDYETEDLKKINKAQRLNLGLKKKGGKGTMKQYMMSILARTKIEEEVTIKKSAFQSYEKNSARASSLEQKTHQQDRELISLPSSQKKALSHNKIKPLKHLKARMGQDPKKSDIKLPDIHEHKNLVQMVKKQEQRRDQQHKKREMMIKKVQPHVRQIHNEVIPQQLEYSTVKQEKESEKVEQKIEEIIYN